MVPLAFHAASAGWAPSPVESAPAAAGRLSWTGTAGRIAALVGLVALGVPTASAAQALGTMQVTARVLPASAAWAGIVAAGAAAQEAIQTQSGTSAYHNGLIRVRSEIRASKDYRLVLVTIDYPHN
jgi:hypothetical protein